MEPRLGPAIGALLKEARTAQALSLNDVQEALHVNLKYLQALENDDYGALPPGVYARGLIRQYAAFVGLDPTEILARYGRARPPEREVVRPALQPIDRPPLVSLKAIVTVLVVAVCIGLFGYLQAQYNSLSRSLDTSGAAVTPPALPTPGLLAQSQLLTPFPTGTPVPAPTATVAPTPIAGVMLEARTTDRTWLQVWVDGSSVLAETLPVGAARTFTARQGIRLRAGNAAGVQVSVNGVPQPSLGAPNQAVEATWTLG
jgi:cytoskeletal protein RodZ